MIRRSRALALVGALGLTVLGSVPAFAQAQSTEATTQTSAASNATTPAPAVEPRGPSASATTAGFRANARAEAETPAPAPQGAGTHTKQGTMLMIIGGAAFLAGALVGDDAGAILMVGGVIVAIWGLYRYLN